MKKVLIRAALALLGLALVLVGTVAYAFMGRKAAVDGVEINGVRVIAGGIEVVPLQDGKLALVDAGTDANGGAIFGELSRRGVGADAVEAILITHGHPDHIGAIGKFPHASVMALEAEVPLIEGRASAKGPLPRLFPVRPTGITVSRSLRDGEDVSIGGTTVRVFAVPGHTAGSAAYLIRDVLFIGDSADAASDGTLIPAVWIFSDSQEENRRSLVSLDARLQQAQASVAAMIPAHSGVFTDGRTQLDAFAARTR